MQMKIFQQFNYYRLWILMPASLLVVVACKRETVLTHSTAATDYFQAKRATKENSNSPAPLIAASEKLEIPAAIELPANLPYGNERVATFFAGAFKIIRLSR